LIDRFATVPVQSVFQGYLMAAVGLARGETVRSGKLLDSLARDSAQMPPFLRSAFRGAKGWRSIILGDTAGGLKELRSGVEEMGQGNTFFSGPLRWQLATTLVARPQTRDEGMRLLRHGFDSDLGMKPFTYFALGKASELANQRDSALANYGQFLRLWSAADSTAQPRVQEAKDAMARLTKEKS
jgi:hypothetical protein